MLKNIVFVLITILVFFLLLEGIFRLIYPFWYKKHEKEILEEETNFYKRDPVLGWTLTPDFEGERDIHSKKYYYKTNSLGIRDKDYPFKKPESVYRIICLGDSITEEGLSNEAAYPKLLEKKINAGFSLDRRAEVINAGIVDYGIEQEYLFLKERGLNYKPDMVILGYFLNDGRGFVPSKAIFLKGFKNILGKSRFLYMLDKMIMKYRIKYQYKIWEKDREQLWRPVFNAEDWRNDKKVRYKLIELSKKDWGLAWTQKGWERTEYFLNKISTLSKSKNFKFVVLAFPITLQLYADASDSYMFLPQERLSQYCRDNKIILIDLLPYVKKYKEEGVFYDHCHHTPFGLELISQALYDSIKDEISEE